MGAIATTGLLLALSVAALELYLVHSFRPEAFKPENHQVWSRWLWKVVHHIGPWIERSPMNGLLFSLGLSVGIGFMFPAAGVIVMIAGVLSTLLTQPVYAARRKYWAIKARLSRKGE